MKALWFGLIMLASSVVHAECHKRPEFLCQPGTFHIYVYLIDWLPGKQSLMARAVARHESQLVEFDPGGGGTFTSFEDMQKRFLEQNDLYYSMAWGSHTVTFIRDPLTDPRMPPRTQARLIVQKTQGDKAAREFINSRFKDDLKSADELTRINAQMRLGIRK